MDDLNKIAIKATLLFLSHYHLYDKIKNRPYSE